MESQINDNTQDACYVLSRQLSKIKPISISLDEVFISEKKKVTKDANICSNYIPPNPIIQGPIDPPNENDTHEKFTFLIKKSNHINKANEIELKKKIIYKVPKILKVKNNFTNNRTFDILIFHKLSYIKPEF